MAMPLALVQQSKGARCTHCVCVCLRHVHDPYGPLLAAYGDERLPCQHMHCPLDDVILLALLCVCRGAVSARVWLMGCLR
jgi:hypothetical protein